MRERWSESKVADRLRAAVGQSGVMPTVRELRALDPNVSNMVCRYGPKSFDGWADLLGLPRRAHASRTGWEWESWVEVQALDRGLLVVRRGNVKSPFDLCVNGHRVDVKVSYGAFIANGWQWTWRIGKVAHTCDVYALVAARTDAPPSLYLVPSSEVPLTCTTHRRRYAAYLNNWPILD